MSIVPEYEVYDITDKKVSWVIKWLEKSIEGATEFNNVGIQARENDYSLEPALQGLSLGELQQVIVDTIKNDINHGRKDECLSNLELEDIIDTINTIKPDEQITHNDFVDDKNALKLLDEYVYSLNSDNVKYLWTFANKVFYVK